MPRCARIGDNRKMRVTSAGKTARTQNVRGWAFLFRAASLDRLGKRGSPSCTPKGRQFFRFIRFCNSASSEKSILRRANKKYKSAVASAAAGTDRKMICLLCREQRIIVLRLWVWASLQHRLKVFSATIFRADALLGPLCAPRPLFSATLSQTLYGDEAHLRLK